MTSVPPIHPTAPTMTQPSHELDRQGVLKSGGIYNWVINALNELAGNQGFLLEIFEKWLDGVKGFSSQLQAVQNALQDLLSPSPQNASQDLKTLTTDLPLLKQSPSTLANSLTKLLESKYGTPLPKQWQDFVNTAAARLTDLVNGIYSQLQAIRQSSPTTAVNKLVNDIINRMGGGEVPTLAADAAAVQAQMQGQNGQITPTWSAMNSLFDSMTNQLEGAQFLNSTVSAREQEIASQIQAVFQGAAKVVNKQFQTLMAMIRLVMGNG